MDPLRIFLQITIATGLAALVAFSAARLRFSLARIPRTALDILFLLPLALSPSLAIYITCSFLAQAEHIAIGADSITAIPLFYLCAWMGFRRVDRETIDAARLQGLGRCGIFWRVWFPAAWPWLLGGFVIGLSRGIFLLLLAHA